MALANAVDFDDLIRPHGGVAAQTCPPSPSTTVTGSVTFWSTSIRTPTTPSTCSCASWPAWIRGKRPSRARLTPAVRARLDYRGGRFRPVHLRVPRCGHPQHSGLRTGLPERQDHHARTELSFDADHSGCGQRGDRKNEGRKPKKLWTALGKGEQIVGYAADNAQQEAGWIATEIARIHTEEDIAYS